MDPAGRQKVQEEVKKNESLNSNNSVDEDGEGHDMRGAYPILDNQYSKVNHQTDN